MAAKPATKKQLANGIVTAYNKSYESKFARKSPVNRYSETWNAFNLLEDYSYTEVLDIIEYFFSLNRKSYEIKDFFSNFSDLISGKEESERRRAQRMKLLSQTKRLVEEQDGKL